MKRAIALGVMGILVMSMLGCAAAVVETEKPETGSEIQLENDEDQNTITQNEDGNDSHHVTPTDDLAPGEIIAIGKIFDFKGDTIHIISGDLIKVYEYDKSNAEDYYIGQTVQLIKGENGNYLDKFSKPGNDYTIRHSNMGLPVSQISGQLTEVNDSSIVVSNEDGKFLIETHSPLEINEGSQVTAYAMNFGEKTSAVMVLNEDSKLNLSIAELSRDDSGSMLLLLEDTDGGQYTINASASTLELNMAELSVGDELTVYHNGIMESRPMQLDTVLIRK